MNSALCDLLVQRCIEMFEEVCSADAEKPDSQEFGVPPKSMIIKFGFSGDRDDSIPIPDVEAAYRYSAGDLQAVPADTEPDCSACGMYHREALALLCYYDGSRAKIMISFGKRNARCFGYIIKSEDGALKLTEEKLLWVS